MKRTFARGMVRGSGLLSVFFAGALILVPPLLEKRTERRVRAMLLEVQEALQRYHVAEELYPKQRLDGRELVSLLVEDGHLDAAIANPWSQEPYHSSKGPDWLRYRTDSTAETYELTVLFPGTEEVEFRLDSTKNQSLESGAP